jgi:hypothetical protein
MRPNPSGVKWEGVANRRKMIRAAQMISQRYAAKTKGVRSLAPLFEGGNESV